MKRHLPNFITLLNLLSGCIAVVLAVEGNLVTAAFFVFLGIFFDFFDGLIARKLHVQSALGVELDSLADMITSGLVPGIIMFKLLNQSLNLGWNTDLNSELSIDSFASILPLLAFVITLSAAYRLAKFNISEDQKDHFIGLPTPANALLILSLPLILEFQGSVTMSTFIYNTWFLIVVTLISSFLMNAPLKLISLKFADFSFNTNIARYLLIALAVVSLLVFKFAGIPLIILFYIVISLFQKT